MLRRTKTVLVGVLFNFFIIFLVAADENIAIFDLKDEYSLNSEQNRYYTSIKKQKGNVNPLIINVKTNNFSRNRVNFNFSSQSVYLDRDDDLRKRDLDTWVSTLKSNSESANFIIKDNYATGTFIKNNKTYSILPIGGGLHTIFEKKGYSTSFEHPPIEKTGSYTEIKDTLNNRLDNKLNHDSNSNFTEISVLVVYTNNVSNNLNQVDDFIKLAFLESNNSFIKSNIKIRLNLTKIFKVSYQESYDIEIDLKRLVSKNDNYIDEIHELRDKVRADIVVMLINDDEYCGYADSILASEESAFAVVHYNCATGYFSFAHEIGHLLGARHNVEVDDNKKPFEFGHGFYIEKYSMRTIMSYNCNEDCVRKNLWSNPNVTYKGVPLGITNQSNNVKVLNKTKNIIANFR